MRQFPWRDHLLAIVEGLPTSEETTPHLLTESKQQQGFVNQWDVSKFFESQIDDRLNFGLGENAVSIITAVLAGLCMLLLADIVFRLVVRHRTGEVSKYSLYRYHLIHKWSNPLSCITLILQCLRTRRTIRKHGNGNLLRNRAEQRYPVYKTVAIIICSILLLAAELSFIFLATSRNTRYDLDMGSVPSFEIRDEGLNFFLPGPTQGCSTVPVTTKSGFQSLANLQVCGTFSEVSTSPSSASPNSALVSVSWVSAFLKFTIRYREVTFLYDQYVQVTIQNGTAYRGKLNIKPSDCLNALRSSFERNQLPILQNKTQVTEIEESSDNIVPTDNIRSEVLVLLNVTSVPLSCRQPARMFVCISGLVRASFHPTGRGKGIVPTGNGNDWRLDELEEPLVVSQRPWLGVLPSIALAGSLGLVFVILNIIGWEGSIDGRWAWKEFFTDTYTVGDFRRGGDEIIQLEGRVDAYGNDILGYNVHQVTDSSDLEELKT